MCLLIQARITSLFKFIEKCSRKGAYFLLKVPVKKTCYRLSKDQEHVVKDRNMKLLPYYDG